VELHFLGGATTVTGSQFLLVVGGRRILVDCGLFQGGPNDVVRNRVPFAFEPREIDALLLTHAHLDHCGLIPHLVEAGFRGPIYTTAATAELAELVLRDSGRLQEEFARRARRRERRHPEEARRELERAEAALAAALADSEAPGPGDLRAGGAGNGGVTEGEGGAGSAAAHGGIVQRAASRSGQAPDLEDELRRQPPVLEIDLDEPLYDEAAARRALHTVRPVAYGEEVAVAPGVVATLLDAGHILGSAIVVLRAREAGMGERLLVFSGDLGRPGTPIIRDPTPLTGADYLIVESTYGGRRHDPPEAAVAALADAVREVASDRGVLLIPAFAVGRTQEIIWELNRLVETGAIPALPLFLDSPMATRATEIYRRHREDYDEETRRLLMVGEAPLDYPHQVLTTSEEASEAIARAPRPHIIVAANGMLTGGRVVYHLARLIDDPAATVLLVGYQGTGTLGAHLEAGARSVRIDGQERTVRCRIRSISGFSAHADEAELLAWIAPVAGGGSRQAGGVGGGPVGGGHTTPAEPSGRVDGERGSGEGSPPLRVPRQVFLVHGDPPAQAALAPKIAALGLSVTIPRWRQRVALE
jgi:metallo-beta-lactamase family protein